MAFYAARYKWIYRCRLKRLNSAKAKQEERGDRKKSDDAKRRTDRRENQVIRRHDAAITKSTQRRAARSFYCNDRNWKRLQDSIRRS